MHELDARMTRAPRQLSSLGLARHLCLASGLTLLLACRASPAGNADAAPPPVLGGGAGHPESPRAHDELWQRALEGDAAELARLADREGAGGLLDGLEEGGAVGLTALLALPLADDAELAYARLAEILGQVDPADSAPLITAVRSIAQRPRAQAEPWDPPGMRACGDAVLAIARRSSLSANLRAPAISTARLLAERHAVDPAAIPRDLDAP